ncbi:hypothetical protein BUE80_DR011708 [Diplocarpon rosae]|nr:hypothetical protein BUE80_DR011708 [Diplocarpon rosae]
MNASPVLLLGPSVVESGHFMTTIIRRSLGGMKKRPETSQSNVGGGIEFSRQSYASSTTDISRSSVLSFQCSGLSGEKLFPDEGAWLSSPLPDSLNSKNRRRSSARGPDHRVQSWLNDTSETEVGEDIDVDFLAQATILSPSRAHLVRLNRDRTSGVATTTSFCPPPYHVDVRYDCASSDDSPPDTTTGEWEFDDNRSARKELPRVWEPQWIFPNRPPDLAKASPPITPRVFPGPSRFSLSTMSAGLEKSKEPDPTSRFSNPSTISEPKSTVDIISDLEDTILRFPSAMLVPSAPCMRAIRLNLAISRSQGSTRTQTQSPMIKNFSLPRRSPALKTSKSSPAVHTTFCRSSILPEAPSRNMQTTPCHGSYTSLSNPPLSTSSPAPTDEHLPSLDLEALHRIFPGSTEFTRLALYAHILAYAFINSLPPTPTPASSTTDKVAKTRRDTPYWSDSPVASNFADATFTSSPGVQIRNTALRASIRKCIFRLLNNMDSSLPIPSTDQEYGSSELVLRSVSEVVQGCEELAFSSRRF